MKQVDIIVNKSSVYEEVGKTTSYIGAKSVGDADAYERIFTTDEDRAMLERFWREASGNVTSLLKPMASTISDQPVTHGVDIGRSFTASLNMPDSFPSSLTNSINNSLYSYFVQYISSKWLGIGKEEDKAKSYMEMATVSFMEAKEKLFYRERPKRIKPTI